MSKQVTLPAWALMIGVGLACTVDAATAQRDSTRVEVEVTQSDDDDDDDVDVIEEDDDLDVVAVDEYEARRSYTAIKIGGFNPDGAADEGLLLGIRTGMLFDERVDVSINADYYRSTYDADRRIATSIDENGNVIETTLREIEATSNLIPIGASVSFRVPTEAISPYVGAGLAYNILITTERNFEDNTDADRTYTGFGWQLFGGATFPIGPTSSLLGEVWYNDATVDRDLNDEISGLPVEQEVDVTGVGVRAGVEFTY